MKKIKYTLHQISIYINKKLVVKTLFMNMKRLNKITCGISILPFLLLCITFTSTEALWCLLHANFASVVFTNLKKITAGQLLKIKPVALC
jgi:hypothetical protein